MIRASATATFCILIVLVGPAFFRVQGAQQPPANPAGGTPSQNIKQQTPPNDAGFQEFSSRVNDFMKLHKAAEKQLPKLKSTDLPEMIVVHQHALARKLKEARPHAKMGDIFTPAAAESFRRMIHAEFSGPNAPHAQATLHQGAPLPVSHLRVNSVYPDGVAYTSLPPTLLLHLPKLPDEVIYRIVGHELLLVDVKANLIVDVLPDVIP